MSIGTNTAFPCTSNGLKFRSRVELERVIEQFAQAGTGLHRARERREPSHPANNLFTIHHPSR